MSLKIVYFGTPPLSAHILEYLLNHGQNIVAIVTRPDKPRGRSSQLLPSAVKAFAMQRHPEIPVYTPEKASAETFVPNLSRLKPDVFIVVSYGEIIKQNLLDLPAKKCINVHFSLLPKYRGAAPMQRTLMAGEKETGITIMEMVLKMDAGDIIQVEKIPVDEDMTFGELESKLTALSGPLLMEVLQQLEQRTLRQTPQDHDRMSLASKITLEDRIIDWGKTAEEIHNQIRGITPYPGAFTFVTMNGEKKRLGIQKTKKVFTLTGKPGETLVWDDNTWIVACKEGALALTQVQLEGKKSLPIGDFLRGQAQEISIVN